MDFNQVFDNLENMGFYDVILPFLLVFTLTFAILEKVELFGAGKSHKFNTIIALVFGLLMARSHTLVEFINAYLPNVSTVIVVALGLLIVMGVIGINIQNWTGKIVVVLFIVSMGGMIWAFTDALGGTDIDLPFDINLTDDEMGMFAAAAIVLGVILFVRKKDPNAGGGAGAKMGKALEDLGNSLKGGGSP